MARAPKQRSISIDELRANCETLERSVRSAGLASDEEITQWRPGSESNTRKDAPGWLTFFYRLHRFHARGEMGNSARRGEADEAELLAAHTEEPVPVELDEVDDDGNHLRFNVYPKSWQALQFIASRELRIEWLIRNRAKWHASDGISESSSTLERIDEELAYHHMLLIGSALSEGNGIPYTPTDLPDDLPMWLYRITPFDIDRIYIAFLKVNGLRLHALRRQLSMVTQGQKQERQTWSTFFSTNAEEHHTTAMALMRDRSLAAVMAQSIEGAIARKAAYEASATGAEVKA